MQNYKEAMISIKDSQDLELCLTPSSIYLYAPNVVEQNAILIANYKLKVTYAEIRTWAVSILSILYNDDFSDEFYDIYTVDVKYPHSIVSLPSHYLTTVDVLAKYLVSRMDKYMKIVRTVDDAKSNVLSASTLPVYDERKLGELIQEVEDGMTKFNTNLLEVTNRMVAPDYSAPYALAAIALVRADIRNFDDNDIKLLQLATTMPAVISDEHLYLSLDDTNYYDLGRVVDVRPKVVKDWLTGKLEPVETVPEGEGYNLMVGRSVTITIRDFVDAYKNGITRFALYENGDVDIESAATNSQFIETMAKGSSISLIRHVLQRRFAPVSRTIRGKELATYFCDINTLSKASLYDVMRLLRDIYNINEK